MELNVTTDAAKQLRQQLKVTDGASALIRLKVERPANGHRQQARVVPLIVKQMNQPIAQVTVAETTFYVDFADEWFFSGQQVTVDCAAGKVDYLGQNGQSLVHPQTDSDASTSASQQFEEMWY